MSRERAWDVLDTVLDPEVPALSVRDLGIVRDVVQHGDALEVKGGHAARIRLAA